MKVFASLVALSAAATMIMPSVSAAQDKLSITLLNALVQDEFWQGCTVGAKRAAEKVGATLTELDGNGSVQTQANQIDTTIQKHPNAILVAALDSNAMASQLGKAMQAGIDVYAFNTAVPHAKLSATVAMDEEATGAAAAQQIIKLAQAKGLKEVNLLHLVGAVATEPVRLRRKGFNDEIAKPIDGLTVKMTEVITEWKPETAVSGLQDALTKGHVDAIFTESDFLTPFLVPVLQRNGYTDHSGSNSVIIGGLGGIPGGLKAIRDGWQDFTLNYPIDGMCSASVYLAADKHKGADFDAALKDAEADLGNNAPRVVPDDKAGPSILLTANLVDKSNVDDTAFWANTFKK
jgi:ABC-type sugar transport system substrate-binding protein